MLNLVKMSSCGFRAMNNSFYAKHFDLKCQCFISLVCLTVWMNNWSFHWGQNGFTTARFSKFKCQINICWSRVCMKGNKKSCRTRRDRPPFLITVARVSTNQRRSSSIFLSRWGNKSWFPNWAHSQFLISVPPPPLHLWLIFSDLNNPRQTASSSARSQTAFSLQGRVAAGQTRLFSLFFGKFCTTNLCGGDCRRARPTGSDRKVTLERFAAAAPGQVTPPFCLPRERNLLANEEKWKTERDEK